MTKIYEALEKAKTGKSVLPESGVIHFPKQMTRQKSLNTRAEPFLIGLWKNLAAMLPNKTCRIIQFIEPRNGQGGAALVHQLSKTIAFRLNQRILLLDASHRHPSQVERFNIRPLVDWSAAFEQHLSITETLHRVGKTSLFVSQFSLEKPQSDMTMESDHIDMYLEELKSMFTAIVIDGPVVTRVHDPSLLSRSVDGVVLVVESEKTRWQVAEKIKQRLANQGGNVLGVILNKQRYPIPGFIYNRI